MNELKSTNFKIEDLKGQLIVSCQALEDEPLYGSEFMAKLAKAAFMGGAKGIRANSVVDIVAIKKEIDLPVIGLIKKQYSSSKCYITPTMAEVDDLYKLAGTDIVAVDATMRIHPNGHNGEYFIMQIKEKYPHLLVMADVSTYEEGISAWKAGADLVSTTLSGYTDYSPKLDGPDFELVKMLSNAIEIPLIAEGRIWNPKEVKECLDIGAYAVVVGTAITRPMEITKRFKNGY